MGSSGLDVRVFMLSNKAVLHTDCLRQWLSGVTDRTLVVDPRIDEAGGNRDSGEWGILRRLRVGALLVIARQGCKSLLRLQSQLPQQRKTQHERHLDQRHRATNIYSGWCGWSPRLSV